MCYVKKRGGGLHLLIIKHNSIPGVLGSIQTHTCKHNSSLLYYKKQWFLDSILPSTFTHAHPHVFTQTLHSISLSHISLSIKQSPPKLAQTCMTFPLPQGWMHGAFHSRSVLLTVGKMKEHQTIVTHVYHKVVLRGIWWEREGTDS